MSELAPTEGRDPDVIYDDYLRRRDAGEALELEALCRAHPEAAPVLRRREAARTLLEALLPGPLAGERNDGADPHAALTGQTESLVASAQPTSASDVEADTIQDLLARLRAAGPRSSRYRVLGEIARGGMGIVLRVVDTELRRKLAMKVARGTEPLATQGTPPSESKALDRFLQEAQVTSQLDHPGIVPVYEIGIGADGRAFFTMRLVRGQTLKAVFELVRTRAEGWTQLRAVHVLLRVCETMSYAHGKSTIHRDLKPANIMVGRFGEVYVMDWGLARVIGRPDWQEVAAPVRDGESEVDTLRADERDVTPDSPRLTIDGEVLGTPAYMAPEQAAGEHDRVGPRSDVYAVGAMLYHLISGEMPYVAEGEKVGSRAVRLRVVAGPPRSLHEFGRKSPAALVAICEKAMARRVEDRYADMRALANDLRAYTEGRVVAAYETGSWAETKMWVRRNKALAGVLALALGALVAGGIAAPRVIEAARRDQIGQRISALDRFATAAGDPVFGKRLAAPATEWWFRQADALLGARAELEEEVERLRGSHDLTEEHRARALRERVEELETKRAVLLWRRQMLGEVDRQKPADAQGQVEAMLAGVKGEDDLERVNKTVFRLVRPDEPRVLGSEVLACTLAERIVRWHDPSLIKLTYRDTYAIALSRVGKLDEAVQEQQRTVAEHEKQLTRLRRERGQEAADLERDRYSFLEGNLRILTSFRDEWSNVEYQRGLTEDLAADVDLMEREIIDNAWSLAIGDDARWYRDVARALRHLRHIEHRVSVARRSVRDAAAVEAWRSAIDDLATATAYGGGMRLTPQIDLLPLGRDPASDLWEFAHLPSGRPPRRGADGKFEVTPDTGIVFVLLPRGRVPREEGQLEFPMHRIELDPFFLSKYELTEQQWIRLGGEWTRKWAVDSPERAAPLNQVTWLRASSVLAAAGGWLCLPTSAQWEYGCRGNTSTRWWTGVSPESLAGAASLYESRNLPLPVRAERANAFGLHDTLGSSAEWCCDGVVDAATAGPGDARRDASGNRRWLRGGHTGMKCENLYTGFGPAQPGEEDLDRDGDSDLLDEAFVHSSIPGSGVRPARPVLR